MRLDPPLLVSVSDKFELLPTVTLPNAKLLGFGVNVPCVTPVPDKGMFKLVAVDVMLTFPDTAPPAVGAKVTVNEVLWPAFNVIGNVSPLMLKPAPLALAAEIVTLLPPLFVSVSDQFELLPTVTLPNARLLGFGVKVPGVTPVPESGKFMVEFEASEVKAMLPLTLPADGGVKLTEKLALWPAPSVRGKARPLRAKLALVRAA